jgi:hypothetical protein
MKVRLHFGIDVSETHIHKDGYLYYCCLFHDDLIAFPFLVEQEINSRDISKLHLKALF